MVCWLVGGKCVKRKLSKINFYQHQTLSNITIDKYKQLFNQQKSSGTLPEASDQKKKKSKILTFSSVRTPPANTSTVQKYGPGSNGSGQDMNWPQKSPKQLVSISHATPDLIRPPHNFQLSVFNPKSQIAMHMTRK